MVHLKVHNDVMVKPYRTVKSSSGRKKTVAASKKKDGGIEISQEDPVLRHFQTRYKCGFCKTVMDSQDAMLTHLQDDHSQFGDSSNYEVRLECDVCRVTLGTRRSLLRHMKTIHPDKTGVIAELEKVHVALQKVGFECGLCKFTFKRKGTLEKHMKVVHQLIM
jgi:hypothetical protein